MTTTVTIPAPNQRAVDSEPRDNTISEQPDASQGSTNLRLLHAVTVPISLNFFRGQISYLRSQGFDVQAVSSPGEEAELARVREGITVHEVPMNRGISPLADIVSLWRLMKLIRRVKPDIVHSHTPKAGLLGTMAARLTGTRGVMLSIFGLPQMTSRGFKLLLLNTMTRFSCRLAHRVWCDSHSMRRHLIESKLCRAAKIVVLGHGSSNGIESSQKFNPASYSAEDRLALRAEHGIPADALTVCFVGRIVADKGIRELAGAWLILREKFPDLHLLIVGPFEPQDPLDPKDEELLRTDSRIHLAGMRQDVPRHLAAVDLLVNPSYREGFNVALLEASAMGLPVIATRVPGCADPVVEGVTGTLVPVRDPAALAQAIEEYLLDPELRKKHGEAGRERILRDFQPKQIWQELELQYRELLGRKEISSCALS
jgi:glycosyltransferase involved in cell wall biosynthesis